LSIFSQFAKCIGDDPNGRAKRDEKDSPEDRWRKFHISELKGRDYKVDSLKWLRDESLSDTDDMPDPVELAAEAIDELEAAVSELNAILDLMGNGYAAE
jgi:type I restriction enzyme M protein